MLSVKQVLANPLYTRSLQFWVNYFLLLTDNQDSPFICLGEIFYIYKGNQIKKYSLLFN